MIYDLSTYADDDEAVRQLMVRGCLLCVYVLCFGGCSLVCSVLNVRMLTLLFHHAEGLGHCRW